MILPRHCPNSFLGDSYSAPDYDDGKNVASRRFHTGSLGQSAPRLCLWVCDARQPSLVRPIQSHALMSASLTSPRPFANKDREQRPNKANPARFGYMLCRSPNGIRLINREFPIKRVWCQNRRASADNPQLLVTMYGFDITGPHDSTNSMFTTTFSEFSKIMHDTSVAINTLAGSVRVSDQWQQSGVFDCSV